MVPPIVGGLPGCASVTNRRCGLGYFLQDNILASRHTFTHIATPADTIVTLNSINSITPFRRSRAANLIARHSVCPVVRATAKRLDTSTPQAIIQGILSKWRFRSLNRRSSRLAKYRWQRSFHQVPSISTPYLRCSHAVFPFIKQTLSVPMMFLQPSITVFRLE